MSNQTLSDKVELLIAQMTAMQARLDSLQRVDIPSDGRSIPLDKSDGEAKSEQTKPNTSRRRILRRLAGGMLAGLAVGTVAAMGPENAQARMLVDPRASDSSRRIGAIVVPPGASNPTGIPTGAATVKYGLVATDGSANPFNLASLPGFSTGVYGTSGFYGVVGSGFYGVVGSGTGTYSIGVKGIGTGADSTTGVYGEGSTGVEGSGTDYGVYGTGTVSGSTGVKGSGTGTGSTGVSGYGNGTGSTGVSGIGIIGVKAVSYTGGISSPALRADHNSATGIAAILNNSSSDTTLLINNAGAGPLLKAWANGVPKIEFTIGGLIKANGGFQTGGADLAEFIPIATAVAEPALEAGEVVEIDPQQPGLFRRCGTPGSLAVAGVISTRPGMMLGANSLAEQENSGLALALAGRIPVKVCAEGGAIQPGDLLEAASVAGHARRASSPIPPGSIVGKALGSLQEGTGIVEMLVMLR